VSFNVLNRRLNTANLNFTILVLPNWHDSIRSRTTEPVGSPEWIEIEDEVFGKASVILKQDIVDE
jgi:hypothetical protein